jgi:hypothetical protein
MSGVIWGGSDEFGRQRNDNESPGVAQSVQQEAMKFAIRNQVEESFKFPFVIHLGANALILFRRLWRSLVFECNFAPSVAGAEGHNGVVILGVAVGREVVYRLDLGFRLPQDDSTRAPESKLNVEQLDIVPDLVPLVRATRPPGALHEELLASLEVQFSVFAE